MHSRLLAARGVVSGTRAGMPSGPGGGIRVDSDLVAQVTSRLAGGAGELLKSFKLFSSGKGEIGPNQLLKVMQELGINVNKREAYALFGRFDINKDGGIVYYEFIDSLMAKGEAKRSEGYYDK